VYQGFICWHHELKIEHQSYILLCQILEKKHEYSGVVCKLLKGFKKACGPIRREVLYNGHMEFGISMQRVKLIKTVLKESYSKACTGKYWYDTFPTQNGPKQGGA
jgi:hypothetical protein